MPDLSPPTSLTVLPWQKPLVDEVVAWFIARQGWGGDGPLDLSRTLVVVPTRQSGRRLREALAGAAEVRNQAVLAPLVTVPEALPGLVAQRPEVASREQVVVAWTRVLLESRSSEYRRVFPVDPPRRDEAWARRLAERLQGVQRELASGGLRMGDVAALDDMPEKARWRELARLEERFEALLGEQQVVSAVPADIQGLAEVRMPDGIESIVVAGCPDPNPISLQYLQVLAACGKVDVLVYGPGEEESGCLFDAWGRPHIEHWPNRALALPDFKGQVQLAADPAHQARMIAARAQSEPAPAEWLNLALADPAVIPPLIREFEDAGQRVFLPEGESWRRGSLFGLLQALSELVESADAGAVGNLLRCPAVMVAIDRRVEGGYPADQLLRHWDRVLENHLAPDLAEVRAQADVFPKLQATLAIVAGWVGRLQELPFTETARSVPAEIFGDRRLTQDSEQAQGVERWMETVAGVERALELMPGLSHREQWRLALAEYGEGARFDSREVDAVELNGWLEVLWADAPRLVVAGANEGVLPESIAGDAFLPEALRRRLGLKTNDQRFAVDAYLMAAAVASRPDPGDVLILVGKTAASGDPLRPSRILLAGEDATLPDRVEQLFRPLDEVVDNLPWQRAWKLRPRRVKMKPSISVTGLRDWLDCPFRFYLSRGLGMTEVELPKSELNAMDFGSLVHGVLEEMGQNPDLRTTTDVSALREKLVTDLERRIVHRYGEQPPLPLLVQFESARQRLRRLAAVEVTERAAGWQTDRVEWEFSVRLGGLTIVGKIDRIDRHEDGRVRVIDYKTSDRAADPLSKHLGNMRDDDHARPDWLKVMHRGREKRWVDLQLPLYRLALAEEFGRDLECAYFNLPKAISETGLSFWEDDDGQLQAAAEACAQGVAQAIETGDFWPPVDQVARWDDHWNRLFHHGIRASVDENWIQQEADGE